MQLDRIVQGDCVRRMRELPEAVVDLAFADPPFNIGYEYDRYKDDRPADEYLNWSKQWMREVSRVLKPTGAFWLAIGDEYAAELKVIATRELGFVCRSWVVWYYTFGVHCEGKFTRSHAHLFHFVKDAHQFTFNTDAVRVPSARQLVYADKRANPAGRTPDDTWIIRPAMNPSWILRPQDLPEGFGAEGDTWCLSRVCGTFKERKGFHGCQMPEQLLGRIIRVSSNSGDLVLDPFAGSGTTLAVAKKLERRYLGLELSRSYTKQAVARVHSVQAGDPLDGSDHHARSTPRLSRNRVIERSLDQARPTRLSTRPRDHGAGVDRGEIALAFVETREGYSIDRVIADPELNARYLAACRSRGLAGTEREWNRTLLGLRKASKLSHIPTTRSNELEDPAIDDCEWASELVLGSMRQSNPALTLDEILCDPKLVSEFDRFAMRLAPGHQPLHYRWAALRLRKRAKRARELAFSVAKRFGRRLTFGRLRTFDDWADEDVAAGPAVYLLGSARTKSYIGETPMFVDRVKSWRTTLEPLQQAIGAPPLLSVLECNPDDIAERDFRRGLQSFAIGRKRPKLNFPQLACQPA